MKTTERGVLSVARFCYVFPCELRGPAWAVGSYSISQSAGGTSQTIIFKTLRLIGRPALYIIARFEFTAQTRSSYFIFNPFLFLFKSFCHVQTS